MYQEFSLIKPMLMSLFLIVGLLVGFWATGLAELSTISDIKYGSLRTIRIEGINLTVEVARDKESWAKGLSGRERLPVKRGMLFVFPKEDFYRIWMKGMKFPIDVIWVNEDGVIVEIWKNATPDSYPNVYIPSARAKYVIEVNADWTDEYNINIGDRVYKLPK